MDSGAQSGGDLDRLRDTNRWFLRNGLPQFVENYTASRDIWTRARPAMITILVTEAVPEFILAFLPEGSVAPLMVLFFMALVLVGAAVATRRGWGYWFSVPDRVGSPFILFFLFAPPVWLLLSGLFQGAGWSSIRLGGVLSWLIFQASLLLIIYILTRFAVIAMTKWAFRQTFRHFRDLYTVATKALPLLLIVMIVLFINTEMWQVAGTLEASLLWASVGMLLLLGVLVTLNRTRAQVAELDLDGSAEQVFEACRGTPLAKPALRLVEFPPAALSRSQRANLLFAAMATQAIQAFVIGLVLWLFFVVFGVVTVTLPVQETWLGAQVPNDVFITFGTDHGVSRALLRVSTFIAGFAAFYVTIYAASDEVYRESFSEDAGAELQRAINVRRAYAAVREQVG